MNKHRSPRSGICTSYFITLLLLGIMLPGLHFLVIHNNSEVEANETETATLTSAIEITTEEVIEELSFEETDKTYTFHYPSDVEKAIAKNNRQKYVENYIPIVDQHKREEAQRREEETKELAVLSTTLTGSPIATTGAGDETASDYTYYANYQLTAYCATGNACADGVYPSVGYTVASNDPNLWHKWIYIDGWGTYYVHDKGAMPSNVIDIFLGSYNECIQFGRRSADIYVYN